MYHRFDLATCHKGFFSLSCSPVNGIDQMQSGFSIFVQNVFEHIILR